jgi:hypothetical protein
VSGRGEIQEVWWDRLAGAQFATLRTENLLMGIDYRPLAIDQIGMFQESIIWQ